MSVCLVGPLYVKYLGGYLVPKAALDYCSSWYRYVQQKDYKIVYSTQVPVWFKVVFSLSIYVSMSGLTWVIILLSSFITGITGLSTSAIATNGKIRGGLFTHLYMQQPACMQTNTFVPSDNQRSQKMQMKEILISYIQYLECACMYTQ